VREALFQHLLEADAAVDLGGVAGRRRHQRAQRRRLARQRAAEQQPGGAAGGAVVGADRGLAQRARHVGEQRHHMHAGAHQLVDRELDRRHVGREQGHAIQVRQLGQLGREDVGIGTRQAVVTSVMCWWRNSPAVCATTRSTRSKKPRRAARQYEGEP
jgi:hypothetical protein